MKWLFPDQNPPILPQETNPDEACIWLLAVMDEDDRSRKFVASILSFFIDRGYLTDKQMDGLQTIASKMIRRHLDGDLQCQGAAPAAAQKLAFGQVLEFPRNDGEVSE